MTCLFANVFIYLLERRGAKVGGTRRFRVDELDDAPFSKLEHIEFQLDLV